MRDHRLISFQLFLSARATHRLNQIPISCTSHSNRSCPWHVREITVRKLELLRPLPATQIPTTLERHTKLSPMPPAPPPPVRAPRPPVPSPSPPPTPPPVVLRQSNAAATNANDGKSQRERISDNTNEDAPKAAHTIAHGSTGVTPGHVLPDILWADDDAHFNAAPEVLGRAVERQHETGGSSPGGSAHAFGRMLLLVAVGGALAAGVIHAQRRWKLFGAYEQVGQQLTTWAQHVAGGTLSSKRRSSSRRGYVPTPKATVADALEAAEDHEPVGSSMVDCDGEESASTHSDSEGDRQGGPADGSTCAPQHMANDLEEVKFTTRCHTAAPRRAVMGDARASFELASRAGERTLHTERIKGALEPGVSRKVQDYKSDSDESTLSGSDGYPTAAGSRCQAGCRSAGAGSTTTPARASSTFSASDWD